MRIEGIAGIPISKEQHPELVIPVTNLEQTEKNQVENNLSDSSLRSGVSGESSENKGDSDPQNLAGQVERANQLAESLDRSLSFFVHEDSGRPAVNVVDNTTHQVIRTVPPERFLNLVAKVEKIAGIFFDEFV